MVVENKMDFEKFKEAFEKKGYYAKDELIYFAFSGFLNFAKGEIGLGQDIYAICLDGPPGAGKTLFAEIYTKVVKELYEDNVEMLSYQCDATTGKSELFEEINITAVVSGDIDKINIPGKLIDAINKVNRGEKVVLFIDEYDKSREETDAFLLQFLQSGKINSVQHGDLKIEDKYKSNLQVILCKNDKRNISGPLSRRLRVTRLDYMTPNTFYKVVQNSFYNDDGTCIVDEGIVNLVLLMYNKIYSDKKIYTRLPACSELLTAIEDASKLLKYAKAPNHIIYKTIIDNLFKDIDNINIFESLLETSKEEQQLIAQMKLTDDPKSDASIINLIKSNIFKDTTKELFEKYQQLEQLKLRLQNGESNDNIINPDVNANKKTTDTSEFKISNAKLKDKSIDDHTKYLITKDGINKILQEPDIEEDSEILSAFDLRTKIYEALKELRELTIYKKKFLETVNNENTIIKKTSNFFKKKEVKENIQKLEYIMYETEKEGISKISFKYVNRDGYMSLARKFKKEENDIQNIYFDDYTSKTDPERLQMNNEFVKKYQEQILNIFEVIEKWHNIIGIEIDGHGMVKQSFAFDVFKFIFKYISNGEVSIDIISDAENRDLFSKNWVGEPSINSILTDNLGVILKKIPICKSDLDQSCINMLSTNIPNKTLKKIK